MKNYRNSPLMKKLEASNWNSSDSILHVFNTQDELDCYLQRSKEVVWWNKKGCYDFENCEFNFDVTNWDSPVRLRLQKEIIKIQSSSA